MRDEEGKLGSWQLTEPQKELIESHPNLIEKIVAKLCYRYRRSNCQEMRFTIDDIRSSVHYAICLAARHYNPSRGPFESYAAWSCRKWLFRKHKKTIKAGSIDGMKDSFGYCPPIIEDNNWEPPIKITGKIIEVTDDDGNIHAIDFLDSKHVQFLKQFYMDGVMATDIAKTDGVSRQAVCARNKLSLQKIREAIQGSKSQSA
jgi:DNA-directed RNA polymerase specialized sigma subunit